MTTVDLGGTVIAIDAHTLSRGFAARAADHSTQRCILAGSYCDASRAPGAPSKQGRYKDPGEPGPWLCLAHPDDPDARGLERCTSSADPDDEIPGFEQSG